MAAVHWFPFLNDGEGAQEMKLTMTSARRVHELPLDLSAEFPTVPLQVIEHDVEERVRQLITGARFDDYVPLLARRTVREHLRMTG